MRTQQFTNWGPARAALASAAGASILFLTACAAAEHTPQAVSSFGPNETPISRLNDRILPPDAQQTSAAQEAKLEERVASCMAGLGFEYTPFDAEALPESAGSTDTADFFVGQGTREWAAEKGYGVSTLPLSALMPMTSAPVDQNQAYLDTLSPAQQQAFQQALYGEDSPEASEPTTSETAEPSVSEAPAAAESTPGCYAQAYELTDTRNDEGRRRDQLLEDPEFTSFLDEMYGLSTSHAEHPVVISEHEKIGTCLAAAGITEYDSTYPAGVFQDRLHALLQANPAEPGTAEPGTVPAAPKVDPAALAALQDEEIAAAVAEIDCGVSTGATAAIRQHIIEAETEFLNKNKTIVDKLLTAYATN